MSSKALFFIRLPFVMYSFIVMWVDIIYTAIMGEFKHFFAYFTNLTFIGLHAYLITTLYHHIKYLWTHQTIKRPSSFLDQPSVLNYLYVYLYHTIIVYNLQTPVVFWALLSKEKLFDAHLTPIDFWISISLHTVTLFILVVEVCLNRMMISIKMIFLVFGTVLIYLFLVFIIYSVEKWWVYSFLDWSFGPSIAVWYIAISVFIIICFFFQLALHKLRDLIAQRFVYCVEVKNMASTDIEKENPISINQTSNFGLLASTIGGGSRFTFGTESNIELHS
ncbi:uncharacterized protein BX663DRAFT_508244 [Cokeromyces recurvatus]|uniref:uncharacterized protein n=1 Tax=Cokeromyces recurvatus TaxID=90255 RepID=UPI00221EC912|nr:uncharacterized protein BX663DRAFT_508244 [Cokeromyces recurvatus]KAI7903329.1 hypothetical protein BX663DRAFT_508244 [Cokeromyces recurvatus]